MGVQALLPHREIVVEHFLLPLIFAFGLLVHCFCPFAHRQTSLWAGNTNQAPPRLEEQIKICTDLFSLTEDTWGGGDKKQARSFNTVLSECGKRGFCKIGMILIQDWNDTYSQFLVISTSHGMIDFFIPVHFSGSSRHLGSGGKRWTKMRSYFSEVGEGR